jgi:hypothetical protein
MKFIPAGEIIGDAHQVRAVTIAKSPQIPDGEYQFVDMYCNDPLCDCRKTMIQVLHNGTNVATINFGWEPHSFYEKWMGSGSSDSMPEMAGATMDITSVNRLSPDGILGLFNALLDDTWVAVFKRHYKLVKSRLREKQKGKPRRGNT